jgi:hypothetical protein
VLKNYIDNGIVTHIRWNFARRRPYIPGDYPQVPALNHCLYKYGSYNQVSCNSMMRLLIIQWLLYVDIDEFVLPLKSNNVKEYLQQHDDSTIGEISLR